MPATIQGHAVEDCPKCGGPCYDNRAENAARVARGEKARPDFKCKDRACDGAIWPPREQKGAARASGGQRRAASTERQQKQPYSYGPPIDGIDGPPDDGPPEPPAVRRAVAAQALADAGHAPVGHVAQPARAAAQEPVSLSALHARCLNHVIKHEAPKLAAAGFTPTAADVAALTAQLFIAMSRKEGC